MAAETPIEFHRDKIPTLTSADNLTHFGLSELTHCSTVEVNKIMFNLDPNSSTGMYGINTKTNNCIKDVIICINKLLIDGEFPDTSKIAKLSLIYKFGVRTDQSNYRPISVLSKLD